MKVDVAMTNDYLQILGYGFASGVVSVLIPSVLMIPWKVFTKFAKG